MFPMRLDWVLSCKKDLTWRPGIAMAKLSGKRSKTGNGHPNSIHKPPRQLKVANFGMRLGIELVVEFRAPDLNWKKFSGDPDI